MSKKVVTFALPANRPLHREPDSPAGTVLSGPESWIHSGQPDGTAKKTSNPWVIDLSAPRNWFELMQLMWMFPWLATWGWMTQPGEEI